MVISTRGLALDKGPDQVLVPRWEHKFREGVIVPGDIGDVVHVEIGPLLVFKRVTSYVSVA